MNPRTACWMVASLLLLGCKESTTTESATKQQLAEVKEQIKTLTAKIEEVDRKRMEDNKLIVQHIESIAKMLQRSLPATNEQPK